MTPNEQQIDLLMRRFAKGATMPNDCVGHLDADEMNAFAEGALPSAARARYVSHLAECDQCRRQVADLAIASGAVNRLAEVVTERREPKGIWAKLFAVPALRYGAAAAALIIVVGVGFVALRRRTPTSRELVATNERVPQQPFSAVNPSADSNQPTAQNNGLTRTPSVSQTPAITTGQSPTIDGKFDRAEPAAPSTAAPSQPMTKELAKTEEQNEKKADAQTTTQTQQSYAPAPPGEAQSAGRSQSQTGTFGQLAGASGGKVQAADKSQTEDRERDTSKDARVDDAARQSNQPKLANVRRGVDEKQRSGPSRNADNVATNNSVANEVEVTATKKAERRAAEESSQTRSAGGRKFVRQGNAWVDQKFKSSMSVKDIARGSEDFAALDSGLRSIAEQLSGEVIVVWKGKAYRIR